MASAPGLQNGLAERTDIHKSCKSLEVLLSTLNDYCEAAGAVAILHKKLAKALRETAGLKVTGDIAANALNASATIFESLSDVDTKFSKIADKEYDAVSSDVKKWFKKLAKEEKGHDDKLASANAKIKQAGQVYERKTKKNPREAAEEHSRYINLISSLGPEIAQEKYNHSLQITERHASITYGIAATLARISDAEWTRSCESVRKFSPTIGKLGEWRSLCEGGWIGPIPQDLPDIEEEGQPQQQPTQQDDRQLTVNTMRNVGRSQESTENTSSDGRSPTRYAHFEQDNNEHSAAVQQQQVHQRKPNHWQTSTSTPPSSFDPPKPSFVDSNTGSVRSLSAFPSPPTHFPIPPLPGSPGAPPQRQQPSSSSSTTLPPALTRTSTTPAPSSQVGFPSLPRLTESPTSERNPEMDDAHTKHEHLTSANATPTPVSPTTSSNAHHHGDQARSESPVELKAPQQQRQQSDQQSRSTSSTSSPPVSLSTSSKATSYTRGDHVDDRDFGGDLVGSNQAKSEKSMKPLERVDTGASTGSIVTAMRSRYSQQQSPSTPVSKEIPRLPQSVNNLASRYEPSEGSSSPRLRAVSPPAVRQHSSNTTLEHTPKQTRIESTTPGSAGYRTAASPSGPSTSAPTPRSPADYPDDIGTRHRKREDEILEKEQELVERQREIEHQARALERDRANLMGNVRSDTSPGPRVRHTSFQQQRHPNESSYQQHQQQQQQQNSSRQPSSQHHLSPPEGTSQSQSRDQSPSSAQRRGHGYSQSQPPFLDAPHAASCGCDTCSASQYRAKPTHAYQNSYDGPTPHELRPPDRPLTLRPEKPKGWIRRLSMPVGQAFSLSSSHSSDSKKGGIFSQKNASTNTLRIVSGNGVYEDGRMNGMSVSATGGISSAARRSYDVSGVSNRSMSNLGRR